MALTVGTPLPDIAGHLSDGSTWRSLDALGKPLVIYFYPKDFTPGCTREACSFRDNFAEIGETRGATVIGVSRDSVESHRNFIARHGLPFQLLADEDGSISRACGATMLGGLLPVSKRVTYVVDGKGTIRGVFDHTFAAEKHVADVRALLEELSTEGCA
ncbi:MAG: peroxiredoxin [Acidobacteria bacterium]|nr:peroxiredoxin [Acidobacteriota bacterium]